MISEQHNSTQQPKEEKKSHHLLEKTRKTNNVDGKKQANFQYSGIVLNLVYRVIKQQCHRKNGFEHIPVPDDRYDGAAHLHHIV